VSPAQYSAVKDRILSTECPTSRHSQSVSQSVISSEKLRAERIITMVITATTDPYPEQDKPIPHRHMLLLYDGIYYILQFAPRYLKSSLPFEIYITFCNEGLTNLHQGISSHLFLLRFTLHFETKVSSLT
jgi:hypothetical protein